MYSRKGQIITLSAIAIIFFSAFTLEKSRLTNRRKIKSNSTNRLPIYPRIPVAQSPISSEAFSGGGPTLVAPALDNSLIPPSPEAASLGKFGLFPVTLYTGMPQISVPIFEIKTTKLSLPISLEYNYNGYKPSEQATWAGLGWTLNAGGAITRVVEGMPDDFILVNNTYHHWQDYANINDFLIEPNGAMLNGAGLGWIDTQPDIYSYSFGGHSGKFIMVGNRAYTFPRQDISITYSSSSGFTIITEEGTQYNFNNVESTNGFKTGNPAATIFNSAWFLSRIMSSDGTDIIGFNYTADHVASHSNYSESYTYTQGAQGCFSPSINVTSDQISPTVSTQKLVSITANNQTINFIPQFDSATLNNPYAVSTRLAEIDIYNSASNVLIKKALLSHGYFNGSSNIDMRNGIVGPVGHNHLMLNAVNIWGYGTNLAGTPDSLLQSYSFQYNNATGSFPADTRGIDTWGYYNGQDNNVTLYTSGYFPVYSGCNYQYSAGNRTVYPQYCANGILSQITYPTGGYSVFNFENNIIGGSPGPGMRIKSIASYDNITTPGAALLKTYTYAPGTLISQSNTYNQYNTTYFNNPLNGPATQIQVTVTTNFSSPLATVIGNQFYYPSVTEMSDSSGLNGSTNYQYIWDGTDASGIYLTRQIDYNSSSARLRSKSFTYSQGTSFTFSGFAFVTGEVNGAGAVPGFIQYSNLDTIQRETLYQPTGSYQYISTCQNLIATDDTTFDQNGLNPVPVHSNYYYDNPDYLKFTRIISTNSKGQQETMQYKYPADYSIVSCITNHAIDSVFIATRSSTSSSYQRCIKVRDSLANIAVSNGNIWNNNSLNTAALQILEANPCETNYYTNSQAMLSTLNSNVLSLTSCRTSAVGSSYTDANNALLLMQAYKILKPVEQIASITKSGSEYLTMAIKTDYTQVSGSGTTPKILYQTVVPTATQILKSTFTSNPTTYYQPRIYFNHDASHNNLDEQYKVNDIHDVYLWGYNSAYPVAKVTGSNYATVSALITQSNLDVPGTDAQLRTYLNNTLRTGLPAALVTTYTYSPLIGMTSETDPRGYVTYYGYDALGRLCYVKDNDGNVIKTYTYHYQNQ